MRKILITGGTNFVSRYVAEHFVRNGDDVTVINRGSRPQRSYFCFHDYAYSLDVKRMAALMPDTLPLADGIAEEWEWYRSGDREINRRPYIEWIDNNLNC